MNEKLGRGLSALIPDSRETDKPRSNIMTVSVDRIVPNRYQPRRSFEPEKLQELADSIRENGIIQPIIVTKTESSDYELIAGERRLQAARMVGLTEVPVVIRSVSHQDQLTLAVIENIQREDLNPVEEALAYQTLSDEFGLTHSQIANTVGKDRATVTNALRLLKLHPDILFLISEGNLTAGHARAVLSVGEDLQIPFARYIVSHALSVRQAEMRAKSFTLSVHPEPRPSAPDYNPLAHDLTRILGVRTRIQDKGGKGWIVIEYDSPEEMRRLKDMFDKLR
ncbi:MAG: ParB/RepB/Spo0J family partition protein [Candidatus Cloacimonetes bacterium]|nr:ParB/RepB/Spo0J family partition protein [Candidatus Cloacimonadota bacterium]